MLDLLISNSGRIPLLHNRKPEYSGFFVLYHACFALYLFCILLVSRFTCFALYLSCFLIIICIICIFRNLYFVTVFLVCLLLSLCPVRIFAVSYPDKVRVHRRKPACSMIHTTDTPAFCAFFLLFRNCRKITDATCAGHFPTVP